MKVSKNLFYKSFKILMLVFLCMFIAEFISIVIGHPITDIFIADFDVNQDTIGVWLLRSFLSASFIGSFFNFFLTVKIIKEAVNFAQWPVIAIVLMIILFPLEIIISAIFVIPNIIIFGVKSRKKHN